MTEQALDHLRVSAPASSANLGSGFDCLGLALDLPFELATRDWAAKSAERYLDVEPAHPAFAAFQSAGGDSKVPLVWRSPIPPGRGLGFSGAARVAGAYLGSLMSGGDDEGSVEAAFQLAAELEGHGDNAAASAYGGLCVATPSSALRLDAPRGFFESLCVVVWSPDSGTSTRSARTRLGPQVPLSAAVRAIAGTATWVAAVGAGRVDLLREACVDQLHQPSRLEERPESGQMLETFSADEDVLAAWLSGSGPSVAALVTTDNAKMLTGRLAAQMRPSTEDSSPATVPGGRFRTLAIASRGVESLHRQD